MTKIKKVKEFLKERVAFQYEVIQRDSKGGITSVKRIKDQQIFSLDALYKALRFDTLEFEEFYEDQYRVKTNNYNNGKLVSTGVIQIDDIYWASEGGKEGYTDRLTERTIKDYKEAGLEIHFAK